MLRPNYLTTFLIKTHFQWKKTMTALSFKINYNCTPKVCDTDHRWVRDILTNACVNTKRLCMHTTYK